MKKIEVLKYVDNFIFAKLDELISREGVQKTLDRFSSLEDKHQDLIKNLIALSLLLIPFVLTLSFWSFNSTLKNKLALKQDTLETAQKIVFKEGKFKTLKRQFINQNSLQTERQFSSTISQVFQMSGIDSAKVTIDEFETLEQEGLILESKAVLNFKGLSNNEVFTLINNLNMRFKIKIEEVFIKKSEQDNLLKGFFKTVYFGEESEQTDDY